MSKIQISLSKGFLRVAVADLAILTIDFLALVAVSFSGNSIQTVVEVYFPTVLLLEAALCFIVGGLPPLLSTSFSRIRSYFFGSGRVSSIGKHDENERTALFVILLGVFLLLESLAASLLFL